MNSFFAAGKRLAKPNMWDRVMTRIFSLLMASLLFLSACDTGSGGGAGNPRTGIYRISKLDTSRIQFRMLDAVNALRQAEGSSKLELNAQLNAAAATHSRDMAVQNRPWHFGSDGSSPIDRVQRAGYPLTLLGENISETFETELLTLAAWMEKPDTRQVILDPLGRDLGFAWFQEPGGKIWWTLITGGGSAAPLRPQPVPVANIPQG